MNRELSRIGWIPGATNPAEALINIKSCLSSPFMTLINDKKLKINPIGWPSIGDRTRIESKVSKMVILN